MTSNVTPADVPEAGALMERLCNLQGEVNAALWNHAIPTDCVCGRGGFWPLDRPTQFKNNGEAVEFIEKAVRAALADVRVRRCTLWQNEAFCEKRKADRDQESARDELVAFVERSLESEGVAS